jgi:ribosomal protein L21E
MGKLMWVCNTWFVNDTHKHYNQRFWKSSDHVVVNDASHFDLHAILVSVNLQNSSTIVEPLLERGELIVPLTALERIYRVGDSVRIIADPCSDLQNVHHHNIGKFGLVAEVDSLTGEVTFLDTDHSLVGFSSHLLLDEAYLTTHSSDSRSLLPSRIILTRSTLFCAHRSTPRGKP